MRKISRYLIIIFFIVNIIGVCLVGNKVAWSSSSQDRFLGDFIESAYNIVYNRKSDFEGFNYWYQELSKGKKSGEEFIKTFVLESEEFREGTKLKEDFVEKMYKLILGREPDKDGFKYYIDFLDNAIIANYKNQYPKTYKEKDILILRWDVNKSPIAINKFIDKMILSDEFSNKVKSMNIKRTPKDKITVDKNRTNSKTIYNNLKPNLMRDKFYLKEKKAEFQAKMLQNNLNKIPIDIEIDKVKPTVDNNGIKEKIITYLGDNINNVGISFYDILTDETFNINGDIEFKAGSTHKVPLNLVLYDLVEKGLIDLTDTVEYVHEKHFEGGAGILQTLIVDGVLQPQTFRTLSVRSLLNSDNIAANMLISGINQYTSLYREYGNILGYQLNRIGNLFTANEMNKFLKKLYENNNDNPNYDVMMELLRDSSSNIRIGRHIPEGIVFNKYGSFDGNYHDIGIVLGDKPFIVSILTRNLENPEKVIADIGKILYER